MSLPFYSEVYILYFWLYLFTIFWVYFMFIKLSRDIEQNPGPQPNY